MTDLQEKAPEHNITIIAAESFVDNPETQVENIKVNFGVYFLIIIIIIIIKICKPLSTEPWGTE